MKGTKLKKRVVSACLAVMLVASIGVLGVSANNYHDTDFSFTFQPSSTYGTDYTGARHKDDTSYSCMQCITANNITYHATVVAERDGSGLMQSVGSPSYPFRAGIYNYNMVNYVKENGYNWAGILAVVDGVYKSGTATGKWSPDYNPNV